jgi:hypothetical protein
MTAWDEWVRLFASRDELVPEYAQMLRGWGPDADWRGVNSSIIRRWSPAGLRYIKTKAWKDMALIEAGEA